MSAIGHELWLASAGTGKTYRLTGHFLGLLLRGVEPGEILATTFTRKAAGEILDRVLERLRQAALGGDGLADLRTACGLPELTADECLERLVRLARRLDRFQVRTIDSFFVQLTRLFALDLELPPDWSIGDEVENEALRAEALQVALGQAEPLERTELLRGLRGERSSRRVHDTMLKVVARGRELFGAAVPDAIDAVAALPRIAESEVEPALQQLERAELPANKTGKPNGHFVKARNDFVAAIRASNWDYIVFKGLGGALGSGQPVYHKLEFPDELIDALEPLWSLGRAKLLDALIAETHASASLIERFDSHYAELEFERGRYRFEDLPRALVPRGPGAWAIDERALDLWFRLDARLNHLLLDEFQDTGPDQWRVLEPLASELVADGSGERSFFCVGDVKQSIYGFRQAEPRLLGSLEQRFPGLAAEEMLKSYRSSRIVLETVNRVFEQLADNAAFAGDERRVQREAAWDFQQAFGAHEAARDLAGAARIVCARATRESEQGALPAVLECAVERTRAALAVAPGATVGILLRKGGPIPALIHALRSAGISASGEGGSPLTDSEAVLWILSLIWLADHPGDSAAAFHVETSPLAKELGFEPEPESEAESEVASESESESELESEWSARLRSRRARRASAIAREWRARLVADGYGETVAALAARLSRASEADGGLGSWDRLRLGQLVELAHAFEERADLRPADFVEWVRRESVETPLRASVRVMTIHKSKGLEFDCVLLPDLFTEMRVRPEELLWSRPDPYGPITALSAYHRQEQLALHPRLAELHAEDSRRRLTESLCVLYVAMTRAARCLELIVAPAPFSASNVPLSYQSIVADALCPGVAPMDEGAIAAQVLWQHEDSTDAWGAIAKPLDDTARVAVEVEAASERESAADDERAAGARPLVLAPTRRRRAANRRSASGARAGERAPLAASLAAGEARAFGTLVHAALEALEWSDDAGLDEEAWGARMPSWAPARRRARALELLVGAFRSDEVRACLARPAGRVELLREYEFRLLLPSEEETDTDGELWTGSIDRLVVEYEGERAARATVIDYKSDRIASAEAADAAEHHRAQLEDYARIVAQLFELDPASVRKQVLFLVPGRVVEL